MESYIPFTHKQCFLSLFLFHGVFWIQFQNWWNAMELEHVAWDISPAKLRCIGITVTSFTSYAEVQLLNSHSHSLFKHTRANNGLRTSCKQYLKTCLTLPGEAIQSKRFLMDHTHGRCCPCEERRWATQSQDKSLAQSLKHLIRTAGALRLPKEQVKQHPDVKPSRPSGSDHIKQSCKPKRGSDSMRVGYLWEWNKIIQVYSSSSGWLQVYII